MHMAILSAGQNIGGEGMKLSRKQRVLNLVRGEPVDRLPSDIWLSNWAAAKTAAELKVSQEDLMKVLDNHLVMVTALDNHKCWEDERTLGKAVEEGYFRVDRQHGVIFDDWGVGWDTNHEGIYEVFHPMAEDPDLSRLQVPDPSGHHLFDTVEEALTQYSSEYCVTGCQDLTIFERACAIRGFANFLFDLKENPLFAGQLLDVVADYQVQLARGFAARGVDMAFTGGDYGTQQGLIISVEDWLRFEAPRLKRVWDIYLQAGIPIMHHSCGAILDLIPHLIEMGMDVLNPIQHVMPPESLSKNFGERLIFFGGIDTQHLMPFGSPEQVKMEVHRYIELLGRGRGYIVAPDQCLTSDVPVKNILAFVDALRSYSN
jgi:uroporphyrinogen decarboxylase